VKLSVREVYGDDLPHRDDRIWDYITPSEVDKKFDVVAIDPVEAFKTWTVEDGVTTIEEAFRDHAEPWQKRLVSSYRKDETLPKTILVVNGEEIVDGHHRLAALAKNKVRNVAALDIGEE